LNTVTREQIIKANPLEAVLEHYGCNLIRKGAESLCCCLFHDDKHPSMRVHHDKQTWYCDVCGFGGSVIDLQARLSKRTPQAVVKEMAEELKDSPIPAPKRKPSGNMKLVDTYDYMDAYGRTTFSVDRLEDGQGNKRFRQWHTDSAGKRINNLDGVERVLWRLPEVMKADEVVLCEGEKCVKACESLHYIATTNSGGSGGWLAGYANSLAGKHVILLPDSDKPGEKWTQAVMDSLAGKVATMRLVNMPKPHNDIADLVAAEGVDAARKTFEELYERNVAVERGVMLPIYSADELIAKYEKQLRKSSELMVDLSKWLPSFRSKVRELVPGDVVTIIADTGVGKSAALQNLFISQAPLPCLMFQIELSAATMAERFTAIATNRAAWSIEQQYRSGKKVDPAAWRHVWTCPQSHISIDDIEKYIEQAELKMGVRPALVGIDYIGLVQGGGGKRYERLSTIAENIKIMAKATDTVIAVASQVKRKQSEEGEDVGLHDAKDSGAIECSSTLVLGLTRPEQDQMLIRVLKDTRGGSGFKVRCNYDGPSLVITEKPGWNAQF